jgi:hypothetical protein
VALPFIPSDAALLAVQAGVVAAPRVPERIIPLDRLHGRGWAIVPLASIVVVVFAIRFVSDTASGLTYLALIAVPPLAAVALFWVLRVATSLAVAATAALFIIAWVARTTSLGEAAAIALSALSCVTLGVLLAQVTPHYWLKLGILLMAAADTWLVVSDLLQAPNATLIAAHPAGGLPRLQTAIFGSASMGYGDLFVAALLGAALASDRRMQRVGALLTLVLGALFDLLFLVVNELPATVPVALALVLLEAWRLGAARRAASARRRLSTPAGVTPRQAR